MKVYLELKFYEIVFFYVQLCCVNKIISILVDLSHFYLLITCFQMTIKLEKKYKNKSIKGMHSPLHGMILIVGNPHHIPLYAAASW